MNLFLLIAISGSLAVGIVSISINHRRSYNQIFFLTTLCVSISLYSLIRALHEGAAFSQSKDSNPLFWIRITSFIKFSILPLLWLSYQSLINSRLSLFSILRHNAFYIISATTLPVVSLTNHYIPDSSVPGNITIGPAYHLLNISLLAGLCFLLLKSIRDTHKNRGGKRSELFLFSFAIFSCSFFTYLPFYIGHAFDVLYLKEIGLFALFISFTACSTLLVSPRVTRISSLTKILAPKVIIFIISYILVSSLSNAVKTTPPASITTLLSGALFLALNSAFHLALQRPESMPISTFRSEVAKQPLPSNHSQAGLHHIKNAVKKSFSSSAAYFAIETSDSYNTSSFCLSKNNPAFSELKSLRWATPESLQRRRATPDSEALLNFLEGHRLGALICAPTTAQEPSLLLAVGVRRDEAPFTYNDVVQLQHVGDLIDNLIIRSRLTAQAELNERMEKLTMVSRGLAHDLKNLTTPLSTFLNHSTFRNVPEGIESEAHRSASRALAVINDYIDDTLFFTKTRQLRLTPTDGAKVLADVAVIANERARLRHVQLIFVPMEGMPSPADATLLQRLLLNLVQNAIDASAPGTAVTISGGSSKNGGFLFEVADQGSGIPEENQGRIFEPYFSTKVYGTASRGFGLGLTICQKIVELHQGEIRVNSRLGRGTEMLVRIPALPLPS